jgi:uncharacterized tellurite resistance protein B-like protein
MLKALSDLFRQHLQSDAGRLDEEHTLELCAAILMLEIALADSAGVARKEYAVIEAAVRRHFHLDETEAAALIAMARRQVDQAVSLHEFTRVINDTLSRKEKTVIIELLWKVAAADTVIDKYEEYFIRKIADLLYISHKDYIRAKHLAADMRGEE